MRASRKCILITNFISGETFCQVVAGDGLTVNDLRNAVRAEHDINCGIDFLYNTRKQG